MTLPTLPQRPGPGSRGDNIPVASRAQPIAKMRAAADKHLPDYSEAKRQAWAERTVDAYIKRGLLRLEAAS